MLLLSGCGWRGGGDLTASWRPAARNSECEGRLTGRKAGSDLELEVSKSSRLEEGDSWDGESWEVAATTNGRMGFM